MLFKQLFDTETWTYTYLIADPISKDAVFIDPVNTHIDDYISLLATHGLQLKYTFETMSMPTTSPQAVCYANAWAHPPPLANCAGRPPPTSKSKMATCLPLATTNRSKSLPLQAIPPAAYRFYGVTAYLPATPY